MIASIGIALATLRASATQAPPGALDASVPITYFIAVGTEQSGYRPADRQLAVWALEEWQRNAGASIKLEAAPESLAVVRVYWADPQGSQYGEMRPLMVDGRRGAAVYIRPDVEALGEDIARRARVDALFRETIVYLTCLHELGHALGLVHTEDFADIMYFFGYGGNIVEFFDRYRRQLGARDDIPKASGLSGADVRRLRTLYLP
jgi:hypothetical protein